MSCRCSGISLPGREAGNARPPSPNPRLVQGPPGSGALGETPGSASTCAASDDTCPPPGGASPGGEPPQGHLGSRGPEQGRPVHPPGAPALPSPSLRCLTRRAVLFGVNGRMGEPMVESLRADTQKEAREDCLGSRPPRFHPDHGGGGGQSPVAWRPPRLHTSSFCLGLGQGWLTTRGQCAGGGCRLEPRVGAGMASRSRGGSAKWGQRPRQDCRPGPEEGEGGAWVFWPG